MNRKRRTNQPAGHRRIPLQRLGPELPSALRRVAIQRKLVHATAKTEDVILKPRKLAQTATQVA